jgi:hypothetical protein
MTRRRGHAPLDDSLDLLLDTITNTFGGVLFLAILVTVLLQSTEPPRQSEAASNAGEVELGTRTATLAALHDTIDTMRAAGADQKESLRQIRNTAEGKAAFELKELRGLVSAMERENDERRRQLAWAEAATKEMEREQSEEDEALAELTTELAMAKTAYEEELAKRKMSAGLPETHATERVEYVLALRHDRVYCIYKPLARLRGELNVDDFDVLTEGYSSMTILPNRNRGIPVKDPGLTKSLEARLQGVSPQSYHMCVLIWRDSFDAFASLRQAMVSLGFEYRTIIMDEDGVVATGGGGATYVQ